MCVGYMDVAYIFFNHLTQRANMIAPTVQFERDIPVIIRNEMIARGMNFTLNVKQFNGVPCYEGKKGIKHIWLGYDYNVSRYVVR